MLQSARACIPHSNSQAFHLAGWNDAAGDLKSKATLISGIEYGQRLGVPLLVSYFRLNANPKPDTDMMFAVSRGDSFFFAARKWLMLLLALHVTFGVRSNTSINSQVAIV